MRVETHAATPFADDTQSYHLTLRNLLTSRLAAFERVSNEQLSKNKAIQENYAQYIEIDRIRSEQRKKKHNDFMNRFNIRVLRQGCHLIVLWRYQINIGHSCGRIKKFKIELADVVWTTNKPRGGGGAFRETDESSILFFAPPR